ncbi:hypothetical protein [Wolbachia endosymbiont (group A) of Rhinocyllus conicus]|uniref:hypothetical protein n=1 Tax=Wolbachia endosymbiont (group A) of Rhinocyllus conicus TaxID=2954053 RepID=UPI0022261B8F|nr:hypothetical protein [Wolbachia endosymbiont (group A) of Rhinocyllus conicus]
MRLQEPVSATWMTPFFFLDLSVSYFHLPPANCNVRTVMCHATWMTPLKEMNRLFKIVLNRGITFTSKISYYHFLIYVL